MAFGTIDLVDPVRNSLLTGVLPSTYEKFIEEFEEILLIHNDLIRNKLELKEYTYTEEDILLNSDLFEVSLNTTKSWFNEQKNAEQAMLIIRTCLKTDIRDLDNLKERYIILDKKGLHLILNDEKEIIAIRRYSINKDKSEYPYGATITMSRGNK